MSAGARSRYPAIWARSQSRSAGSGSAGSGRLYVMGSPCPVGQVEGPVGVVVAEQVAVQGLAELAGQPAAFVAEGQRRGEQRIAGLRRRRGDQGAVLDGGRREQGERGLQVAQQLLEDRDVAVPDVEVRAE